MKNIELISLDIISLKEVNGGSQHSYDLGLMVGDTIRKWAVACGIIALFA